MRCSNFELNEIHFAKSLSTHKEGNWAGETWQTLMSLSNIISFKIIVPTPPV